MAENNVIYEKPKKILTILSFVLTTIFMIAFLLSAVLKNVVLVYVFMSLFFVSAIFEMVMCVFLIKYLFKKYVGKSNAF